MMPLPVIPDAAARRIIASMALLRSPNDCEVVAAARGIERLLAPYGIYVESIGAASLMPERQAPAEPRREPPRRKHQAAAIWCLEASCWNRRERDFLADAMRLRSLSSKQAAWLEALCARRGREA
jgi:hypothetical protein